jgi:hypothetical protein
MRVRPAVRRRIVDLVNEVASKHPSPGVGGSAYPWAI